MSKTVYSKIKKYFEDNSISYKEIHHKPGASAEDYHKALGCRYNQQAKSLLLKIYKDDGNYYAVLAIPAQKRADLEGIRIKLQGKKIRMANLEELQKIMDCVYGEVPPLGKIFNIEFIMDKDFLKEKELYLNAGKVDVSFVINPKDLVHLENPIII